MTVRDAILDLLTRDAAPCDTLSGVLEQAHRDALIHVINGGNLDVPVGIAVRQLAGSTSSLAVVVVFE